MNSHNLFPKNDINDLIEQFNKDNNDLNVCNLLAQQYYYGRDYGYTVEKNDQEALRLWLIMAESGISMAQFNVGYIYIHGKNVTHDYIKAVYWYKLAEAQNDMHARRGLAKCYEEGIGIEQDIYEAYRLYEMAAVQEKEESDRQGVYIAGRKLKELREKNPGIENYYKQPILK